MTERNEVALDAEIERLSHDLDQYLGETYLPNRGLILAYNFPPFSDASAATVAKRVRQLGREVDVVSQDLSTIRRTDPDLTRLVEHFVDQHFQLSGEPGFAAWPAIRNYVLDGYSAVKSSLRDSKYGFMYSRSMFPAPHFLAAFIKTLHPEVLWISEFSDPVRHDVEGNERPNQEIPADYVSGKIKSGIKGTAREFLVTDPSVFSWCEILGVVAADRVIFTNAYQRDAMVEPYLPYISAEDLAKKTIVSPHPTLGAEFYRTPSTSNLIRSTGTVNIGYFGEFYPNRGVGELVQAVSGLAPEVRRKFRLYIFTNNVILAQNLLRELSMDTAFVEVRPSKDLFTFLRLATEMDALYVSDVSTGFGYTNNPYLPSKVSDYRGAGVPIIASVWPGSVLSKDDNFVKFVMGDVAGLQGYLADLMR